MAKTKRKTAPKSACPWCGKVCAAGPMVQHLKGCERNPKHEGYNIIQPTGTCEWCGYKTTRGALATHMAYGCPKRPADGGGARRTCRYCGEVTSLPGAIRSHEKVCHKNPANPQPIPLGL